MGRETNFCRGGEAYTSSPIRFLRGRQKNTQADGLPDVAQTASDTAEVMWLRDFLPDLIPNARIATYSYESASKPR